MPNDMTSNWREMLGEIYAGKRKPESFVLVDLNLDTDIGMGTAAILLGPDKVRGQHGHMFIAAEFSGWCEFVAKSFDAFGPELVKHMREAKRDGHTVMFAPLEAEPDSPGAYGRVSFRIGLALPHAKRGAEWAEVPGFPVEIAGAPLPEPFTAFTRAHHGGSGKWGMGSKGSR